MKIIGALAILLFAVTISYGDDEPSDEVLLSTIPIYSETHKLEDILRAHPDRREDAARLAEIYFLTSRCKDAVRVAPDSIEIRCICGDKCTGEDIYSKTERFRRDLLKSNRWDQKNILLQWKQLKDNPEAQYFAANFLRQNSNALKSNKLQSLRSNLESVLSSLEVKSIEE